MGCFIPEITEVEKMRWTLNQAWIGRSVMRFTTPSSTKDPRKYVTQPWLDFLKGVRAKQILSVLRHGKKLRVVLSDGEWRIFLGSTGWFVSQSRDPHPLTQNFIHRINEKSCRILIYLDTGEVWEYHDPRTWGKWEFVPRDQVGKEETEIPDWLWQEKKAIEVLSHVKTKRRVKDVLVDQRLTAGLGNYMANELCHRAGIHPHSSWEGLLPEKKDLLIQGIPGFIQTCLAQDDHSHWLVFKRAGQWCRTCGNARIVYTKDGAAGSRGSYYCLICQPC